MKSGHRVKMHEDPVLPFSIPSDTDDVKTTTDDAKTTTDDVKTTTDDVKTTTDDVKTTADDMKATTDDGKISSKQNKWKLLRQRQGGKTDVRHDFRLLFHFQNELSCRFHLFLLYAF